MDTHPLHWHLYDVQVLNRVTWDNIVSPPDPTELGWKDTLRVSPLEDTIVALRPIIPQLPFELPNSIRPLHPMMPLGSTMGFNNVDADGNPTAPIVNALVNFGWEYVWHCHILSHEEMDMMRPVSVALPPKAPIDRRHLTTGKQPHGDGDLQRQLPHGDVVPAAADRRTARPGRTSARRSCRRSTDAEHDGSRTLTLTDSAGPQPASTATAWQRSTPSATGASS